jgi:phosphoserine aminotransferase
MSNRAHVFNAGPAVMPVEVLQEAREHLMDFHGEGLSLMEMSHRSKTYDKVHQETIALAKEVMKLPENYKVVFMQGGATLQFAAVPLNLAKPGQKVQYVDTGAWSAKAIKEAQKLGYNADVVASSKADDYVYIPAIDSYKTAPDAAYLHLTSNNTIRGTEYHRFPDGNGIPVVVDMSSDINCRELDYTQFDLLYAGAQKNMGPSGVTFVVIKDELLDRCPDNIPTMTHYKTIAEKDSLYNTPPTFGIYLIGLVLKWIKNNGGLAGIEKINRSKADLLYKMIDGTDFYRGTARKEDRSLMNVTFRLPSEPLEKEFVAAAASENMIGLKGHRSVGGCRASIYNATPLSDVETLVAFMKEFERRNG